ncbi:MAG: alpha-glucosidase, partial [Clostridia bacterium]|nr:alpha-glucosidase [Clostridia bacterium]
KPYVVGVWPGDSVFPDVLDPEARKWFGSQYKVLLDEGIEGFWNDMNEPSIFYSKKRLNSALEQVAAARGTNMPLEEYHRILGAIGSLANNRKDYAEFYHETPFGRVTHLSVHNLFGSYMTQAAADYFSEYEPDKRFLLFSRSSHIGMHRSAGIWTGDNASWWSHLLLNLKMLPSLNMCGFLYVGADIGGFGDNTTEDLLLRWLALGVFTPLMRNHSTLDTRGQECFRFERKEEFRNLLGIRYALVPYLYSEFVKCAVRGEMMFRPLAFDYPNDRRARTVEDQLLLGEGLMIAPVYEQNAAGRYVYLPESMKMIRMRSATDYRTETLKAGDHYLEIPLGEIVFFVRKGHALPLANPALCVDLLDESALNWISFGGTEYELYVGKGERKSELKNALKKVKVSASAK